MNAIFPDPASDWIVTEVPAPILCCTDVLNTWFRSEDVSLLSAVEKPLTPVRSEPSPTNLVAVTTPVDTILWTSARF